MSTDIEQRIEKALEKIRPALRLDGGGIDLVRFDEKTGTAYVSFKGACVGCPMSEITLKMGVEAVLQEEVPEIIEVIAESHEVE